MPLYGLAMPVSAKDGGMRSNVGRFSRKLFMFTRPTFSVLQCEHRTHRDDSLLLHLYNLKPTVGRDTDEDEDCWCVRVR